MKNRNKVKYRKLISFCLIILFLLLSFGVNAVQDSNNFNLILEEQIFVSKPKFTEINDYISIDINEANSYKMEPGRPILPIFTKFFKFPLGTKIIDVSLEYDTIEYKLTKPIIPCQQFVSFEKNKFSKTSYNEIFINNLFYKKDELYPKKPYIINKGAGLSDGEHVLFCSVQVNSQYSPDKNTILIPEKIDIIIEYLPPKEPIFNFNEQYDMVIIAPEQFSEKIQLLIDHKNNNGVSTILKTTEEIYSQYNGCDEPEKIKYFIKDAIENFDIKYVLLIGDITQVPIRKTALTWEYFGNLVVPDVITDLYYSDIYNSNGTFSTWDTNQDGIFSEIRMIMDDRPYNETLEIIDIIDGVPDVIIGRLPCSNNIDVRNVINKIITYETSTYNSQWFKRLILMGGDTFPNVGGINEGEFVTDYISSIMSGFDPIRLWTSLGTFRPLSINWEISKGAGFVSYSGHGFEQGFATSEPDGDEMIRYNLLYALGIFNGQKYPIMYFDACLTACLDYNIFNVKIPCFAWAMVKKHFGGAVASIGATRVGFGGFSGDPFIAGTSCMHRYFFEAYEPGIYLGDMFIEAQIGYIQNVIYSVIYDPLTTQEFTLIGDPSLKVGGFYNN